MWGMTAHGADPSRSVTGSEKVESSDSSVVDSILDGDVQTVFKNKGLVDSSERTPGQSP